MKKRLVLFVFLFSILLMAFLVSAQDADLSRKGYKCLNKKIDDKTCSSLSLEENIFSVLSTGKCKDQLVASKKTGDCWGSGSSCSVKDTAQAIIALTMQDDDVSSYLPWLLAQNESAKDVDWLLQIDTSNIESSCTLNASNSHYIIQVASNQKITASNPSSCFSIDDSGYWVKIKSSCYGDEILLSCDKDFSTTLFFKKGSTMHVLEEGQSAFSEGSVSEQIDSLCFKKGTSCDYEGTLWATFALSLVGEDTSSYLPYLTSGTDSNQNEKYLPESFLYQITGDEDFSAILKTKQKANKYWVASGNKYYDSAVALFPFSHDSFDEKTNAINWLKDDQGSDGCWNSGNIVDTAFLLYSLWPKIIDPPANILYCDDNGGYCMSNSNCIDAGGSELSNFSCTGFSICCNQQEPVPSCDEMGGQVCSGSDVCDSSTQTASDTSDCCVGTCGPLTQETTSECENNFGICKPSCDKGESQESFSCTDSADSCCVKKTGNNFPLLWVILFAILVLGAVLFLLRKKIFGRKSGLPPAPRPNYQARPGVPPRRMPSARPIQRRPLPPQRNIPARTVKPPKSKPKEDVFAKLKKMSK